MPRRFALPLTLAALLLSPYAMPYLRGSNLGSIKTPVMLQGGTLDLGITPLLRGVYTPLPGPKYYLVLKNETHFAWTNLISLGQQNNFRTQVVLGAGLSVLLAAAFDAALVLAQRAITPWTRKGVGG